MKLGKVIGRVVSTHKQGKLHGLKLLVVRYLDENLKDKSTTAVCTDSVNAMDGDIVLLCASSSARLTARTRNVATDNTIVGIVDLVSLAKNDIYRR